MARPWHSHLIIAPQDGDVRFGPAGRMHKCSHVFHVRFVLGHQPGAQCIGACNRGRQTNSPGLRGKPVQPRQRQRQQTATLCRRHGVKLIKDNHPQVGKVVLGAFLGDQQRYLFRRGDQNIRRIGFLALAFVGRGIAGARLNANIEVHFPDRCFEVSRNVDRQRLQGRDIQRVQSPARGTLCQLHKRRQKSRQRLAAAGRRNQQGRTPGRHGFQHLKLMAAGLPATSGEPIGKYGRQTGLC